MNLPAGHQVAGAYSMLLSDYAGTVLHSNTINNWYQMDTDTLIGSCLNENAAFKYNKVRSVTFVFVDSTQGWINTTGFNKSK